jgi:hypothetical protein
LEGLKMRKEWGFGQIVIGRWSMRGYGGELMGWEDKEGGMMYFLGRSEETAFGREGKRRGKQSSYGLLTRTDCAAARLTMSRISANGKIICCTSTKIRGSTHMFCTPL